MPRLKECSALLVIQLPIAGTTNLELLPNIENIAVKLFIFIIQFSFMPLVCYKFFGGFIACIFF
jgi:hypothetical protein